MWLLGTVFRALAVAHGRGDGTARSRVRTRRGTWLVCHASCLRDAGGALTSIAVVIEPATATEIAPIIVQAYDLTDREQQITRLIARGAGGEIADRLLSPHRPRPRQGDLRQGRRVQPRRAGGQAVRRPLRAHPPPGRGPRLRQLSDASVAA